ncbi:EAL domain-containing protein [Alteromonas sp. a30]|uniref:EAL domain-containing protein n=1 Tax=Alteromonas sp. a30 TaxID=2730917 RepID=UPI0022832296|nr:EAL domain-containing protein [Alteromonas sp. a30]MCY7294163.1 EAL domain-containing protein [Alteromonas sp. a30]
MARKLSVLLVTNDKVKSQEIMHILEPVCSEIEWITNSNDAVKKLKQFSYSAILSDIDIGNLDGWRLARMVRANLFACPSHTPFFLLTSTYCEHIAESTASAFAINKVVGDEQLYLLPDLLSHFSQDHVSVTSDLSVLIVEDDLHIAELASRILKPNYEVETVHTGLTAVNTYRPGKFDIVLLDVQLPEMSGGEVLEHIMKLSPRQAVVIMTAHGGSDLAEELMIAGAVDFIQKPFKAEQLRKVMSIAAHRESYLISNAQFEEKVLAIKRSKEQYQHLLEEHQRLLDHLSTVVMELDLDGQIRFVNEAWKTLTEFSYGDTIGRSLWSFERPVLNIESEHPSIKHILISIISGVIQYRKVEFQIRCKSGQSLWVEAQFNVLEKEGTIIGVTATLDNIDERKLAQIRLNHLASHDTLTDLFNRHYFDSQLTELTESAKKEGQVHSLLYLDLDHFKVINDTQGHYQGDMILKEVAFSLKRKKRETDILCRVGGDEFALLLPNTDCLEATDFAQEICNSLKSGHFKFDDRVYKISCSIGVTEIKGEFADPAVYLQQADIALYVAKRRGRDLVHLFQKEDRDSEDFQVAVHWVRAMQEAIINDQLVLHFQPVIDAENRSVHYYEALVRLDVDDKLIMPGEFIPALERAEDMTLLDHQVISKAIYMMHKHTVLTKVAINLSAQAFSDQRLLPLIKEKLSRYHVRPEQIIFEVTESASLTNLVATRDMIIQLMELGCEFSIDDFGTGFSTFNYLKQLPANSVKIDGSFVKDMLDNPIDYAVVKSIVGVAKALNKTTVAEFVENVELLQALKEMGVDYLQGYFISKPLDIKMIEGKYTDRGIVEDESLLF